MVFSFSREFFMSQTDSPNGFEAFIQQFVKNLPPNLKAFKSDIEQHAKYTFQSILVNMDMVTREEFDTQKNVLAKTRKLLDTLEKRLEMIESQTENSSTSVVSTPSPTQER